MDQENERNISRLWRAFRTVKEMVKDRGYFITQEEVELPLEDFKAKYCDSMGRPQRKMMSFQANPTEESISKFPDMGSLWVEFCDEPSGWCKDNEDFCYTYSRKKFPNRYLCLPK